jgi:outer membrane receptor protein involved in Fe transport
MRSQPLIRGLPLLIVLLAVLAPRPAPAAPVTVLDRKQLEATGLSSLGEILQRLPEQSNATNTQVNNGGSGATRVNLRGLGSERTLVLLNGRRHVAGGTGADASVDLNAIPLAAIERIELLESGGSALYGSEAIGGVVNIVTRREYAGTEARLLSGLSSRGDGLRYDLSLTTGQITGRGSLLFTAGYSRQQDVSAGEREYSRYDTFYDFRERRTYVEGSATTPEGVVTVPRGGITFPTPFPIGIITRDSETQAWRPFNPSGIQEAGGDLYNYQPESYLVTPQQRAHAYAAGGLSLTQHTRAFFEALYTNRQSAQQLSPEPLSTRGEAVTVSANSVYNPFGRNLSDVRRRLVEFGNRRYTQDLTTFRIVTGLEGKLVEDFGPLDGFTWELAFNHGRTQGIETQEGLLQRSRLSAAVGPSFIDTNTGEARCGTPAAPIADCVPLNLLGGPGSITPEMVESLSYRGTARGFNQQQSLTARLSGELFKLTPSARATGLTVGYEHRRESGALIPDPLTAKGDTTGNRSAPTEGRYYVNEAFAELSVPVLGEAVPEQGGTRDILELTGAARVFNYNTFETDFTYQLGSRLRVIQDLTVRAAYSTAFRAPSIAELHSGRFDGYPGATDPCSAPRQGPQREQGTPVDAVCDAQGVPDNLFDPRLQQLAIGGGNPELKPETAKILTVGLVIEPRALENFTAAVDYFHIGVDQSIAAVGANGILASCYPSTGGASELCERITRFPTGEISSIDDRQTNIDGDRMGGLDISLSYQRQTALGQLGLRGDATWLHKFDRTLSSGNIVRAKGTYDLGVYSDLKANVGASWARDALSAALTVRFINGFKECENNTCTVREEGAPELVYRQVKDYAAFDASVAYDWETRIGTATARLGVNNLFDAKPPYIANAFLASSDPTAYDFIGRSFYLRLSYQYD